MTMKFSPETFNIVEALPPCAASVTGDTARAVCLKNANGVWAIIQHSGTDDNDMTFTFHEGDSAAVALAGTYPIAATFPIWANASTATSDTLVRATDAASYVLDSDGGGIYLVVMYLPASKLTPGRDWVALGFDAGHASNFVSALYILDGVRYQQETPPSAQ